VQVFKDELCICKKLISAKLTIHNLKRKKKKKMREGLMVAGT